jgi:hypothetical protein
MYCSAHLLLMEKMILTIQEIESAGDVSKSLDFPWHKEYA